MDLHDELRKRGGPIDILYLHGWILWASWGVLGMIQIVSLRYLPSYNICCTKTIKNFNMLLHLSSGVLILIATLTMSLLALEYYDWTLRWNQSLHSAFGLGIMFATIFVTLLGFIAWLGSLYGGRRCPNQHKITRVLHKYIGYILVAFSQVAIILGVIKYNERTGNFTLGAINIAAFFSLWAFLEVVHQLKLRRLSF